MLEKDEELAYLRNQLRELDDLLQTTMKESIALKIELYDAKAEIKKLKSQHLRDLENTRGSIESTIDKLSWEIRRLI